ncbi:MAG TPA: S1C family serine protease, partial [Candidatus Saccharimonadales bacterium]|nr:S1C family serine protease [Candidatus Saccharimonadales bacterium]
EAVVQIEARGPSRDPVQGWSDDGGRGSGFIIDPAGTVLTNHHVVGELDTVTVFVGPDLVEHEGRVVATSECSDLAVVELEGDGFAWLDWHDGPIDVGLPVYAAGFPLGDPVFTLTGGIVSRAAGVISEDWAWVLQSIEHDANILGGSSGGPVVTEGARVLAVNYALNDEERRSIAISREEVLPILPDLLDGRSVASLGIDGVAIVPDPDFFPELRTGVWANAVRAGSPAAEAGILPGDVLTELDGVALDDGTMAGYCEVLRDREPDETLPVTVYRPDDEATMPAEINGSAVEPPFAFARDIGGQDAPDPDALPPSYERVSDGDFDIFFEIPETWQDVLDRPWSFGGNEVGPGVIASTDAFAFIDGWVTPGVYVAISDTLGDTTSVDAVLDSYRSRFGACTLDGRSTFERGGYEGAYDLWSTCGGTPSRFLSVAVTPEDGSRMVYLQFLAPEAEDLATLDRVLTTLEVATSEP